MSKHLLLLCTTLLLLRLGAHAQPNPPLASTNGTPSALQARITRVERGLSTPVVVQSAPNQKMALTERMAFYQVPAVSIAVINNGRGKLLLG